MARGLGLPTAGEAAVGGGPLLASGVQALSTLSRNPRGLAAEQDQVGRSPSVPELTSRFPVPEPTTRSTHWFLCFQGPCSRSLPSRHFVHTFTSPCAQVPGLLAS